MSWWSAAPELLLAAGWIFVPGTVIAWAAGLRGLIPILLSPAVSVGVLAGWGVVLGLLGVAWGPVSAAGAVALTAGVAWCVRRAAELRRMRGTGRHARTGSPPTRSRSGTLLTVVGTLVGGALAAIPVARAMSRPDLPAQFWDVVFHLNATRYVIDSASASSLTLGSVSVQVSEGKVFYPAGWHTLASLATIDSVVVSSNAVVLVTIVSFVAGVAGLARAVLPRADLLGLFAPLAAALSMSFPASFTVGGGIWPSLLSVALVPAAVAGLVMSVGPITPRRFAWSLLCLVALGGVALAQPSGLLTFAAVTTPLVVAVGVRSARTALSRGGGRRRPALAVGSVIAVLIWLAVWALLWRIFADAVRDNTWRGTDGFWHGVRAGLLDSPVFQGGGTVPLRAALVALLVIGVGLALWTPGTRWLVPALAALLTLAGLAEADNALLWVVMPWYAGPNRLLGSVPVVSALLIGLAVAGIASALARIARRATERLTSEPAAAVASAICVAAVGALLVLGTGGLRAAERTALNAAPYTGMLALPHGNLANADELAMIERLRGQLEPGATMIGDPFRGFGLAYAISDVPVVFPHLGGRWPSDARFLALNLVNIHEDPEVCAALGRLGVRYLYTDEIIYLEWHGGRAAFDGIPVEPPQPGFELVDQGGYASVWRITACEAVPER